MTQPRTYNNPGNRPGQVYDFQEAEHSLGANWINRKPIFRRVITFGFLPNNGTSVSATGIIDVDDMISIAGFAKRDDGLFLPIPRSAVGAGANPVDVSFDKGDLAVETETDMSAFFAFIILLYTR